MENLLKLVWHAGFRDKSTLNQFEDALDQANEIPFKQILDRQTDLSYFCLYNIETRAYYIVDLELGILRVVKEGGTVPVPEDDQLRGRDHKYRLIYFRRVKRTFGLNLKEVGNADITYFLGFQYTDELEKNHKRLIQIYDDGRIVIY